MHTCVTFFSCEKEKRKKQNYTILPLQELENYAANRLKLIIRLHINFLDTICCVVPNIVYDSRDRIPF